MSALAKNIRKHWEAIKPIFSIRSEEDYDSAADLLNKLLDEVGEDESHPLYELLDTLGTVMHAYEEQHHRIPVSDGSDMLRFLMEEHGLRQADLPEIGTQGVISELVNGRRELNVRQIRLLSERFGVSPAVFI